MDPAGTAGPVPVCAERAEDPGESFGIGTAGGWRNTGIATCDDASSPRAASLSALSAGIGTELSAATACVSCSSAPGVVAVRVSLAVPVPAAVPAATVSASWSRAVPAADVSPLAALLSVDASSSAVPAGGVVAAVVPVPVAAVDVCPVPSLPPAGGVAWPPGGVVPPVPALSAGAESVVCGASTVSVGSRS